VFLQDLAQILDLLQLRSVFPDLLSFLAGGFQLGFQTARSFHHRGPLVKSKKREAQQGEPGVREPHVEEVRVLGKLLPQLIVLVLSLRLFAQLHVPLLDDLLQVPPGVFERLHGEPGVWVRSHVVALDLPVQGGQSFEVGLGGAQGSLELVVGLSEGLDLLDAVAANRVSEVFLCIFEPRVEGGRFLGEREVQLLDFPELVLHDEQLILPLSGVVHERLPPLHDVSVAFLDALRLVMVARDQLFLQGSDVLDALALKRAQASIERLLLGEERLHG